MFGERESLDNGTATLCGVDEKELALTMPPSQVNTGLLSPPFVTRETRREWRSPLVIDASSAFGARALHKTWGGTEKYEI